MTITKSEVTAAADRLKAAKTDIKALRDEVATALQDAAGYRNDHLTPDGLAAARQERAVAVRDRFGPRLEQLRGQVVADERTVEGWVVQERQALDPSLGANSAAVWDGVRERLAAGIPLQRILAGADAETARVVEKFGPAWLEAQAARSLGSGLPGVGAADSSWLGRAVEARLAQVAGPGEREALGLAREVRVAAAGVPALAGGVEAALSGRSDSLGSAVEAALAEQVAGADPFQVVDGAGDVGGEGDAA